MSLTMEKLLAKGLRVDDGENLRILSEETDKGSRELSSKTKIILEDLNQVRDRLNETFKLIQDLDELNNKTKILNLAVKITKLSQN